MRALLLLVALLAVASARTINWTGGAGNSLWNFATNWDANAVPTKDDDVVLNGVGGASVTVSQPAVAQSITIGGGQFKQTLTILSSLAVGSGGIAIKTQGTLQLQGNNDLPLSSVGKVIASSGGSFIFSSGDIKGPGQYLMDYGSYTEFSGSALKQLESADLVIHGTVTIQPSAIQLSKGATFTNGGQLTAVGQINIFSTDNSQASFYSYGNFSYNGAAANAPLTFQVATYFAARLDIVKGGVIVAGYFHSAADIELPSGTVLTIQSGTEMKTFTTITGSGSVNVAGNAEVDGVLAVSWVTVTDSGSLTLNKTSTVKSLSVSGRLTLGTGVNFNATDVSVAAGTITGSGQLTATGNFEFTVSQSGNANSFLSARVNIAGNGYFTGSVFLLFADAGNLHIMRNATFLVSSSSAFVKQTGNPVVTNNGAFTVRLAVGSTFTSSVDMIGSGTFSASAGVITFDTATFNTSTINLGTSAVLRLENSVVNASSVGGAGSLNISTAPNTVAGFGDIALNYLGVEQGSVRARSIKLTTLEIWNGELHLSSGSTNTGITFNFFGGTLSGAAKLTLNAFNVMGNIPQVLDAIVVNTARFTLRAGSPQGTFMTKNNAQVNSGNSTNWF